jgi:hypothetical protein
MISLATVLITAALLSLSSFQTDPPSEWNIRVSVQGTDLVTNADARACQVPGTFPIQPGRNFSIEDAEGHVLGVTRFSDPLISGVPSPTTVSPRESCQLTAIFRGIPHGNGYLFRIEADRNQRSTPIAKNAAGEIVATILFATGDEIQVIENLDGTRDCTPESPSAVYPGAQLQWSPAFPTSNQRHAAPWDGVFRSLLFAVPWVPTQHCILSAGVHVPYAESMTFAIDDVALPDE